MACKAPCRLHSPAGRFPAGRDFPRSGSTCSGRSFPFSGPAGPGGTRPGGLGRRSLSAVERRRPRPGLEALCDREELRRRLLPLQGADGLCALPALHGGEARQLLVPEALPGLPLWRFQARSAPSPAPPPHRPATWPGAATATAPMTRPPTLFVGKGYQLYRCNSPYDGAERLD